jgi:hypothetical protein
MIIWLYTETASPVVDGPFYAELDARMDGFMRMPSGAVTIG